MALTLKRLFQKDAAGALLPDAHGRLIPAGVAIMAAAPVGRAQHFTPGLVARGVAEGWLSLDRARLVIHGAGGALLYQVLAPPGRYCCHCDAALDRPEDTRAHLATAHPDVPSPDAQNPSGARLDNFYRTVRAE